MGVIASVTTLHLLIMWILKYGEIKKYWYLVKQVESVLVQPKTKTIT